ncbi:hypothetical protein ACFPYI_15710 [Halomarina salina]|uniref:DUF4395 domain-containing protein n=1 Tax=Halomarina salina TaxID=1872699 RepID=A0ABD5RQL3_9EURY|nr:hypothetical protein [Halomarina salina]
MNPASSRYRASGDDPPPTRPTSYRPGVCNIGRTEQRRRYRYASVGLVATAVYLAAVVTASAPTALVLGAFPPLALAVEFFVQARTRFCVKFALLGRYDFSASGGEAGPVTDAASRRADATFALRITVVSLVTAAVTTGLLYAVVRFV